MTRSSLILVTLLCAAVAPAAATTTTAPPPQTTPASADTCTLPATPCPASQAELDARHRPADPRQTAFA